MKTITASDKLLLLKKASSLPVGSPERKAILASLSKESSLRPVKELYELYKKAKVDRQYLLLMKLGARNLGYHGPDDIDKWFQFLVNVSEHSGDTTVILEINDLISFVELFVRKNDKPWIEIQEMKLASLEKSADFLSTKDRKFEELKKEANDSLFNLFQFLVTVQAEMENYSGLAITPDSMKIVRRKLGDAIRSVNEVLPILEMAVHSDYSNRV